MTSRMNQFARPPQGSSDRPPALEIRYFYCFSRIPQLPIDDPLAPIPPATATASTPLKQPSSPFSDADNVAIERLWNDLRRKIRAQQEKHRRGSGAWADGARNDTVKSLSSRVPRQDGGDTRRGSHGAEGFIQRPTSRRVQLLSPEKTVSDGNDADIESTLPTSRRSSRSGSFKGDTVADNRLGTTGNPFARASSRSRRLPSPWDAESHIYSTFDRPQSSKPSQKNEGAINEKEDKPRNEVTAKLPVGVSQLHQVILPKLL